MTQGANFYVYDPWGRRIFKQWPGFDGVNECEAYFYGATGQKLESYSCNYEPDTILWSTTLEGINTYFGGKTLSEKGVFVATDRLGSVRGNSNGESFSYFPWGEERGTGTADGRTKFAGYYRDQAGARLCDGAVLLATTGSFWSPDPGGMNNANAADPMTWNRYGYVMGDPINRTDVSGLCSDQDNPPCYSVNSAPLPPGPTPGSPAQGSGNDAAPPDLGGNDNDGGSPNPCPPVPIAPASANINQNIQTSQAMATLISMNSSDSPSVGRATNLTQKLFWLYHQVKNKGPWDYKQLGSQYQDFGNFDFGAVGAALGIDLIYPPKRGRVCSE